MKNINLQKNKKGFSTLFIVIILGMGSISLIFFLTASSFWSIRSSINTKNSAQARAMANACAETTLESIRQNNTYLGSGSMNIGNSSCTFAVTNTGGNNRNILVSGTSGQAIRKINITTSAFNPIIISSWQEIP